jgi:hypothetical protein
MACVVEWDGETGEFRHLVGVQSFASYREALQAGRFLARLTISWITHSRNGRGCSGG